MRRDSLDSDFEGANRGAIKRRKIRREEDGQDVEKTEDEFKPGNIMKVRVKNFTTYSFGEFNLSPRLNMIIGPNGSGKSTLVAAICLGLGGKIDLIKRKSMKSMIKTGQEESMIEITLKNDESEEPVVVRREFTERESVWMVDGRYVEEKVIRRLRKRLNIQLDNLCHFLPQERVAEFAGLSPEKLLLETERTLFSGHLLVMHEDLIKRDNTREELKLDIENIETSLTNLIEERNALEEEVRKYEEYKKKTDELNFHKMLIPYAQLQDLKERQKHIKKERDLAKKRLAEFKQGTQPIEEEIRASREHLEQQENEIKDSKERYNELISQHDQKKNEKAKNMETISDLQLTKKSLLNRSKTRKSELESLINERNELEEKLRTMPSIDEEQLSEKVESRDAKHSQEFEIRNEIENLQYKIELSIRILKRVKSQIQEKEAKLTSNDKIVILESNGRQRNELLANAYGAHMHLRNLSEHKNQYFEAPVVSCEVIDKNYAKFVEKVIDNNTLLSITITNQDAYNNISNALFSRFNAPLRLTKESPVNHYITKESLRNYGFEGYLSDFLLGPQEVLDMLKVISKINLIPVSSKPLTDGQLRSLLKQDDRGRVPFMRFIAGDSLFTISKSRYGSKQFFYTTEYVQEARFFGSAGLTQQASQELKDEVESLKLEYKHSRASIEELQTQLGSVKERANEMRSELDKLKVEVEGIRRLKTGKVQLVRIISQKSEKIKKMKRETHKDYTEKIRLIETKCRSKYKASSSQTVVLSKILSQLSQETIEINKLEVLILQTKNRLTSAETLKDELEQYRESLTRIYEQAKLKYNEIKNSDAAQKIREQNESYTEEQRRILSSLAEKYLRDNTLTENFVRRKIQLIEDERSVMSTVDRSAIEELKQKNADITNAERELPNLIRQKEDADRRIDEMYKVWEPELSAVINKISLVFQKRFSRVASDGQVELVKHERFKNWRLQILVKFRENSDLKVLDHQSQSGGERAVSTIFFIMSLQGLTDAPFRVVDEINQGMDPKNEKIAHRYLVHTACKSSKSQYFLITPKLLTGLYYHPKMVIHCIYTSPLLKPNEYGKEDTNFMNFRMKSLA